MNDVNIFFIIIAFLKEPKSLTNPLGRFVVDLNRGVSSATRLVSHHMRTHGREYLKEALWPFFNELQHSAPSDLEVDPNRAAASATSNAVTTIEENCQASATIPLLCVRVCGLFFFGMHYITCNVI